MDRPRQSPPPASRLLLHRGDTVTFTLVPPSQSPSAGRAWLRTNIGRAASRRAEIIREVELGAADLAHDWHDLPMAPAPGGEFRITLPLLEVGRFQAKAFWTPEPGMEGPDPVLWPEGGNVIVKVEPAHCCAANSIYCAFVRQFGENRFHGAEQDSERPAVRLLEEAGYQVIPRSGKFRDLISQLDLIVGQLGFRYLQLLPIFPTPTTYARMGRFGSPFASLDFMDVDPALAEFDRKTTPLDQFRELVDATHARGARILLDIPINHTGWASWLQNHHPEWFQRHEDDSFQSPGAWGVTWGDLSELDYSHRDLWPYIADVFLFWCRQGADGFRCDAGYMVPLPVWKYITAKVRREFPDTVFLLEGLGGDKGAVFRLLDQANLDWAYSELFQNYTRPEVEHILSESISVSTREGLQIHFAETHDNNRLAATSPAWARMRTALAALASHNGGFGITAGVEWFADEKIMVHGAPSLNWDAPENQLDAIATLNRLVAGHPAFAAGAELTLIDTDGPVLILRRRPPDGPGDAGLVLVLVNLDSDTPAVARWHSETFPGRSARDLLTGETVPFEREESGSHSRCPLAPGEVRCLSCAPVPGIDDAGEMPSFIEPARILRQRLRAKTLEVLQVLGAGPDCPDAEEVDSLAEALEKDPDAFCRSRADGGPPILVHWQWPSDLRRMVLLPPGKMLLVTSPHRFVAGLERSGQLCRHEWSLPASDGQRHFALLMPLPAPADRGETLQLHVATFAAGENLRETGEILFLPAGAPAIRTASSGKPRGAENLCALCTNGRGAMALVRGRWGEIRSQYDSLLAANLHPDFPVDRHILWTRCRGWLVHRDYSREINAACQQIFTQQSDGAVVWKFSIPTGMGSRVSLLARLELVEGRNTARLGFRRLLAQGDEDALPDDEPVHLILRPDIENRNFHEKTKAYSGPERSWPGAIATHPDGFDFTPGTPSLALRSSQAHSFTFEPEWQYMVAHPQDAERGLDGASDLFSPGYFSLELRGGGAAALTGFVPGDDPEESEPSDAAEIALPGGTAIPLEEAAFRAMGAFIVKRDDILTVIAGYPWFLDWGRDTLICLRGIIAAGMLDEARDILKAFARFERKGTLPNMIRGGDDSNRETSDAPLWFFTACADLRTAGDDSFFRTDCGDGRTIEEVLHSIARGYLEGTPNGIRVDPDSGLVFSPSHFTWMDTNHPAGTPREGYPIEIQALWHAALTLLATVDPGGEWSAFSARVAESIETLFWNPHRGFLADCLHAAPGAAAKAATADDHLRSNQLLAVTLGALKKRADIGRQVIRACEELLVPGAIRSLADRPVTHPLPVDRDGVRLNDPLHPYQGRYTGDEDTRRKPAYHNGTAWTWPFPSYPEALLSVYGEAARPMARSILGGSAALFDGNCLGQLPEITDADFPHAQKGCPAQAWGATELYRVWKLVGGTRVTAVRKPPFPTGTASALGE